MCFPLLIDHLLSAAAASTLIHPAERYTILLEEIYEIFQPFQKTPSLFSFGTADSHL